MVYIYDIHIHIEVVIYRVYSLYLGLTFFSLRHSRFSF